ncbi:hypothetical protein RJ639_023557 [Escallonia herrerae]|uniref:Retrotransposon Copia-like N-terminal domain-containing protein n=1 Tax=Escallonia herrerae TaxID=1293975 RepID=A0AA88V097_9ASTE|nr:hypothetical protein RJ639_023557 [Escallonia herrerae]
MTGAWRSLDSSETTSSTLGGTLRPTMAHGGDHLSQLSFQLTSHKLTGKNYLEWAQSVKLAIDGRGKLGHLTIIPSQNNSWIIDSGAKDHMKSCSHLFSTYIPCVGNKKIKIADGSLSVIVGTGSIVLSPSITLHNVLHVPKLSCNLLSISKLTNDHKCQANFYYTRCEFQEMVSGRMIGSARASGGLYFFEDGTNSGKHVQRLSHDIDWNKNEGSTAIKELLVYSRRKQIQRNETDASQYCQDSVSQTIQNSIEATSDTHTNPIHLNLPRSESSQSESMSNLDKPIAHRKVYVDDIILTEDDIAEME